LSLEAIMKAIELNAAAIEIEQTGVLLGPAGRQDLPRVVSAARFKTSGSAPAKRTARRDDRVSRRLSRRLPERSLSKRYLADVAAFASLKRPAPPARMN